MTSCPQRADPASTFRLFDPQLEERARFAEGVGVLDVDVSDDGEVVWLEETERVCIRDGKGTIQGFEARLRPTLRFGAGDAAAIAYGAPGHLWLAGVNVDTECTWFGVIDRHTQAVLASVETHYDGVCILARGPDPHSKLAWIGAGQHGQWAFLLEHRGDAMSCRRLGSGDYTSVPSLLPGGLEYVAVEDSRWLRVRRLLDASVVAEHELPGSGQPVAVAAWAANESEIVVQYGWDGGRLERRSREGLKCLGAIVLSGHDMTIDCEDGLFVSCVLSSGARRWGTWRLP